MEDGEIPLNEVPIVVLEVGRASEHCGVAGAGGRVRVINPIDGGPLHVPRGVHVTLVYSKLLDAYIPYPADLLEDADE